MGFLSVGDLANTFQIRRLSSGLKADLARLGAELASGQKRDLGATLAGDFGPLAGIERSLTALSAYAAGNTEAASLLSAMQLALGHVQEIGQNLGPGLLTAANGRSATQIGAAAQEARQSFSAVVSSLNSQLADRSLFGGAATDRPALASGEAMLAALASEVSAQATAVGVTAAVEAWFDTPGGGFETLGYLGAAGEMGPLIIADGETVAIDLRADDAAIRDTLKSHALAALVAEGVLAGDVDEQAGLLQEAAERMLAADGPVTDLRARIGALEARTEDARARNGAEAAAYELARAELVAADPYQTASELQAVYAQIETLYTVTARIAGLRFTDYMR